MATFVDFDLTFTDNSSGVRAEDGTEVQLYSDSPSFVPNVVVDHANALHPWMRIPFVGAGITTIPIRLETPLTFVKVRVRQFNANGNGNWNLPGGGAGELFEFPALSATDAPDAPSTVGLVVVGTPTPPVDPPVDPPPDPEPPSGTTTNYSLPSQYSGTQGSSGWSYKDSGGTNLSYVSATGLWTHASEAYLTGWSGGGHPGPTLGLMYRWTVPETGDATITGNFNLYSAPGSGNGVTLTIKHNASTKFTQSATDTTVYQYTSQIVAPIAVTAGDTLDFILTANQVNNSNCSTQISINIALTGGGGTPTNPTVANISPATLSVNTSTVTSVQVNLSGPALVNSTISLSSTNGAIASVPASVVVPIGQSYALFDITGVANGSATITASYNSSSAVCAVTVSTPAPGTQWPNEPSGMTIVTNSSFSDSLGSEWENVYNTQAYASPNLGGQTFSAPRCFDSARNVGTYFGNGQWVLNFPASSEAYLGFYWGTNAAFQGYSNNNNKLVFIRNPVIDNSFMVFQGAQDAAKVLKWYQQSQVNNTHIATVFGTNYPVDGTGWFECNINAGAATYIAGQPMRFVEIYLKKSTTTTSQNGIIKWWVNGTLCGSYTNANLTPPGFTEMHINHAWDGGGAPTLDLSRAWHHYFDHLKFSRKL